jgi:large subunit ribosomal protein L9
MAIEVMLIKDVPGLGAESDVVRVAEGYARNYLYPQKLAAPVTEATRRRIEKRRRERAEAEAAALAEARALAAKIEKMSVNIPVKAGADGKLFGAVTAASIAETLRAQGVELDRHQIEIEGPVKELGVVTATVHLHPQVSTALKVWVVEE